MALSLPVTQLEGTDRVHVGTITIHPSVSIRELQLDISKIIGVPPCHLISFLERQLTYDRVPIDDKLDLMSMMCCDGGDWNILAVVRRLRTGRARRGRRVKAGSSRAFVVENRKPQLHPEKIILRRNDASNAPMVYDLLHGSVGTDMMMPPATWRQFYHPIHNQEQQRESSRNGEAEEKVWMWRDTWQAAAPEEQSAKAVCGVCETAACLGVDAAFHCCVRDEILKVGSVGRSSVGPIERPSGKRVMGCA